MIRDLRVGLRALLANPGFAAVAVITLALGIGSTSSIFSIVNGTLLNGLPWGDPESIVSLVPRSLKKNSQPRGAAPAHFDEWSTQAESFEELTAVQFDQAYLTDRDEPSMVYAPYATPNGFRSMRIQPLAGRAFTPQDAREGAEPVVMMGERLWETRYGRDPAIVGGRVELNGDPVTVVGIIDSEHWFPSPDTPILRPLHFAATDLSRTDDRYGVFGRLKPGVTLAQAQAEMDVIMERMRKAHPQTDGELGVELRLTRDNIVNDRGRRGLLLLMGAVGFVLLIVCGNLAGLLLARGAAREKEIATRAAVGATRGQLVRQLLAECVAIAIVAFPLALLITRWCLDYFLSLVPDVISYMDQFFRFDLRVVGFAAAISLLTVLVFGLSPALRGSRVDLNSSLKEGGMRGGTDAGSQRLRSALVVGQVALALTLLVSASLFMQALAKVQASDPGFETQGLMSSTLLLPDSRYDTPEKIAPFHRSLERTLATLPGGARAALVSNAPLGWSGPYRDFQIGGRRTADDEEEPRAHWTAVSKDYFATLGLRVLSGRGITAADREGSQPVVVVSKSLVEKYFPGESPIGKRLELPEMEGMNSPGGSREIVGVVSDVKEFNGMAPPEERPRIYEPLAHSPVQRVDIVARVSGGEPMALAPILRQRTRAIDGRLALAENDSMETRRVRELWQGVFFARLMAILGVLAMILAAVGIYGVVSYSTARRTREFGIRTALGAEPRQIAALVLRKTLALGGWGVAVGIGLTLLMSRGLQSLLYEVDARSPLTLVGVSTFLLTITLTASIVPVLRAVRAHPMQSLRVD